MDNPSRGGSESAQKPPRQLSLRRPGTTPAPIGPKSASITGRRPRAGLRWRSVIGR